MWSGHNEDMVTTWSGRHHLLADQVNTIHIHDTSPVVMPPISPWQRLDPLHPGHITKVTMLNLALCHLIYTSVWAAASVVVNAVACQAGAGIQGSKKQNVSSRSTRIISNIEGGLRPPDLRTPDHKSCDGGSMSSSGGFLVQFSLYGNNSSITPQSFI